MLFLIFVLIIYYYFNRSNDYVVKNEKFIPNIEIKIEPYLKKLNELNMRMGDLSNSDSEDRQRVEDLYDLTVERLVKEMNGILLTFPKRFEKQLNLYFQNILDNISQ